MDTLWIEILGVLLLIAIVGFFSASEVAVLSSRKSRMRALADEGEHKAALVLGFQEDPERFLATVHIAIVFSLVLSSGLGAILGWQHLVPSLSESGISWVRESSGWLSLCIIVVSIGFLVVVFGELVPKSLALRSAEKVALRVAPAMQIVETALRYPALILTGASNLLLVPFNTRHVHGESGISEEEFKLILEEGTRRGVIDKTEQELIGSIFEFTDTTAKEVMIPRPRIQAIDVDMPVDQVLAHIVETGKSRYPVYRSSLDEVLGILYDKDLFRLLAEKKPIVLAQVLRPAFFAPDTAQVSRLLKTMQRRRMPMALVVNEYGGLEGLVTIEDLIEEIVGEIEDESDREAQAVRRLRDGSYIVDASISIHDLADQHHLVFPESAEYETLAGFVLAQLQRLPRGGEIVQFEGWRLTIVDMDGRRIARLKIERRDRETEQKKSGAPPE